jgi:hypothetical protein
MCVWIPPQVVLPFYPTATMERISREGEIATANTLGTCCHGVSSPAHGPLQPYRLTTVPLYHCTTVPLYRCTAVPLYRCIV